MTENYGEILEAVEDEVVEDPYREIKKLNQKRGYVLMTVTA